MINIHHEHAIRPGVLPKAMQGWLGAKRRGMKGALLSVLLPVLLPVLLVLSACGGGGDGGPHAGVSSGGTGSFSGGPVRAFGSIVVNGIHFDPTTAESITDAGGRPLAWQDIDLGMMVEIDAGDVTLSPTGREQASSRRIRVTSDLLGPVTSVTASSLTVMGQTVRVMQDETHLRRWRDDGSLQSMALTDIGLQDIVEVHGFQDAASGEYIATRIELKDQTEWADPAKGRPFVVRGVIKDPDATGCTIGSQRIDYVWPSTTPLPEGQVARALLSSIDYQGSTKTWRAQQMTLTEPLVTDRTDAQLEGLVTERRTDKLFSINGLRVESEEACPRCVPGAQVSVRGELVQSVLKVRRVLSVTGP